jgi:hypothetical protein
MKLYVFSDENMGDNELDALASFLIHHSKKYKKNTFKKSPLTKPKISDDEIINLAMALELSVEQISDIMGLS